MRKKLSFILVMFLAMFLLIACSGNSRIGRTRWNKGRGNNRNTEGAETITLAVWGSSPAETEGWKKPSQVLKKKPGIMLKSK